MEPETALSTGDIVWRLSLAMLLVFANAFFVAAEFALVGARRTRIESLAEAGNTRARLARRAIDHLDHYISATQLGITLASLGLGWVGESTLSAILIQAFDGLPPPWDAVATHTVAGVIAFAIITFLHITLGELGPKSLALLFPETMSLWAAGPLIGFSKIFSPFIAVLNGSANLLLRMLGLRPPTEVERVHRPEEIEMLVTQMYEQGALAEEPVEMIRGVFDLSETTAVEVMTPRTEIVAVPADASVDQAAEVILQAGHSRIPVYEGSLDRIVGVILARDVWRAQRDGKVDIAELIRPVPFVPDSKDIEGLLREMQEQRVHMAVVVDEFGGTAGIVTLEDLVEEIVGDIRDEYEVEPPEIEEVDTGQVLVNGSVSIFDLNDRYDLELPEDEYTTVAGYVMARLGRIPHVGEEVQFPGGHLRVVAMEGRRVDRLALLLEPRGAAGRTEEQR
ncbi:MAG TPA: hemolysin family protein [Longimicrobiales bacterium]